MRHESFSRSLPEFTNAVTWIKVFAPQIVESAIAERKRLRRASRFSPDPERREAGKTYSSIRRTLAESLICTTLNTVVDTLGVPEGFKQVTGVVYVPNIGQENRLARDHTWLERENHDQSLDIIDLFPAQLIESTERRFARGQRTKELINLVEHANGVGFETIQYKGTHLPLIYGDRKVLEKTLSIVYQNPAHLPKEEGYLSIFADLLRE